MRTVLFALFFLAAVALSAKEALQLQCRDAGMFSIWMDVLTLCREYHKGHLRGIVVDFGVDGIYYDSAHGENWWTYYCAPIKKGRLHHMRPVSDQILNYGAGAIEYFISRHEANRLIKKYIHIKPAILDSVDQFAADHFTGKFVVTVHYRGTDKSIEAPRVSYDRVRDTLYQVLAKHDDYTIFLATDELEMLDYLSEEFGEHLCYQEAFRAGGGTGIHFLVTDKYQQGLEALIDMLLLSRGHHLIRTSSNLSRWSTWMNPDMPVTELSRRHGL